MIRQAEVTAFYDRLTFPSATSHAAYAALVPAALRGKRVGDFGCGQSLFRETFRRLGCEALFLDIAPSALRAQDYGARLRASLAAIPLPNDTMDAIFCIGVVHHVPEFERALEEIVRVLKPGAPLCLGVYAPWSVQACLRKTYDRTANRFARALIERVTGALIWTRNRRNGLRYGSSDYFKRIDDNLKTPLVRYLPAASYADRLAGLGAPVRRVQRISSMNVLHAEKA
jgi:SAM-dependent methyltransferase